MPESIPRRWQVGLAVAGTLVTLTLLADQPIWDNLSTCGLPQRGALTRAFPSHLDRLWQLARLLEPGELELLGARLHACSRTLPRNGTIVAMTAVAWSALGWGAVRLHGRRTGRCG